MYMLDQITQKKNTPRFVHTSTQNFAHAQAKFEKKVTPPMLIKLSELEMAMDMGIVSVNIYDCRWSQMSPKRTTDGVRAGVLFKYIGSVSSSSLPAIGLPPLPTTLSPPR